MAAKIGFTAEIGNGEKTQTKETAVSKETVPRKCMAQIHFQQSNMSLAYFNDSFELHIGDIVYVDGKLEGVRGRVVDINYSFKIKLSDYHKVIAVVDTDVHGELNFSGTHLISFDRHTIPYEKVVLWRRAPETEEDGEVEYGTDDSSFLLNDLSTMKVNVATAQKGKECYLDNNVEYICIDGTHGRALVSGHRTYELEFEYHHGEIKNLVCDCYCSGNCKHGFAAMLQLQETLDNIEKNYSGKYSDGGYFAAINVNMLFSIAAFGKQSGSVCFG